MSITQLQYLVALARHKHFGKAARACHVTQPTLSIQIQKFEEQLGLQVFDRSASPICQTQEGADIIEQAKRVLDAYEGIFATADHWKGDLSGSFRLALIPTITPYLLPKWLSEFSAQFPHVTLSISELETNQIIAQLEDGDIDGGILATPIRSPRLRYRTLYYEPFYIFLSSALLPATDIKLDVDQLDKEKLLLLEEGHCMGDQALRFCKLRSRPKLANFRMASIETLKGVVQAAGGWTLLPQFAVEQLHVDEKKSVRGILGTPPVREVSLIFRGTGRKKRILDALEQIIKSTIPPSLCDAIPEAQVLDPKPLQYRS